MSFRGFGRTAGSCSSPLITSPERWTRDMDFSSKSVHLDNGWLWRIPPLNLFHDLRVKWLVYYVYWNVDRCNMISSPHQFLVLHRKLSLQLLKGSPPKPPTSNTSHGKFLGLLWNLKAIPCTLLLFMKRCRNSKKHNPDLTSGIPVAERRIQ